METAEICFITYKTTCTCGNSGVSLHRNQTINNKDIMKATNNHTADYYWDALSTSINRRELNQLYPNGYTSFAVKLHRNDKVTLQLLVSAGLVENN